VSIEKGVWRKWVLRGTAHSPPGIHDAGIERLRHAVVHAEARRCDAPEGAGALGKSPRPVPAPVPVLVPVLVRAVAALLQSHQLSRPGSPLNFPMDGH
jgi:hypothetical protein